MKSKQPMGAGQEATKSSFSIAVETVPKKLEVDIGGLGAARILVQALRFTKLHSKFFYLLILFIMLPMTIVALIGEYIIYRTQYRRGHYNHQLRKLKNSFDGLSPYQLLGSLSLILLLIGLMAIACEAAANLASSATLYAVGLHYSGHSVSFKSVLRACIPRKWIRLTVTRLCKISLLYSVVAVYLVASFLCILIRKHQATNFMVFGLIGMVALVNIVWYCIEIIFMVAGSVSVLEKDYGWAAVTKSLRLLKGKGLVAASFLLLGLLPLFFTAMYAAVWTALVLSDTSSDTLRVLRVIGCAVAFSVWIVYLWWLRDLCAGILYVSCKTYHNENLVESIHQTGTALQYKKLKCAIINSNSFVGGQQVHDVKGGEQQVNANV